MGKDKDTKSHKTTNVRAIKVAVFVIAAILIFYLGANFLRGIDTFGRKVYYYTMLENTGGLTVDNIVYVNGYRIGKVTRMDLVSDQPVKVCAEVLINQKIRIPDDSQFEITSKDILGGNIINVVMGSSPNPAKSRDTLKSFIAPSMMGGLGDLVGKLNNTLTSIDTIASSLKDVIHNEGGAQNLQFTLAHIENATASLNQILEDNQGKVNSLITNLSAFGNTLKEASPYITNLVNNFDQIADSLVKADVAAIVTNTNKTIAEIDGIMRKINTGKGDIGQLINSDTIYRNLEASTQNLNLLIKDIKENPGRYVTISLFNRKSKEERQAAKEEKKSIKAEGKVR